MNGATAVPVPKPARGSTPAKAWLRALELTGPIVKNRERILSTVIEEQAEIAPDAPALLSDCEFMTYGALSGRVNQYTRWALQQGLGKGDTVGLLMPNRPEYVAIWLGVARTGCAVALLNTKQKGSSLAHSLNIVAPKHVIVAAELLDQLTTAPKDLSSGGTILSHGSGPADFRRIDLEIEQCSREKLQDTERRPVTIFDQALYIYTSGTTGLPKAARISHARIMQWSLWFAGILGVNSSDRMYNCLPMYHSSGGVLAIGAVLAAGGSVAIREGFSATQFWNDIVRWDCTQFQYIGELCRYLLHADPNPLQTQHRLRMCCGNGLRPDIWTGFKSRFQIPQIFEFYAATEGNVSLFNAEGKPGAIGRIPPYLEHRFPARLVRFDIARDEPARNQHGYCIPAAPDEVGEAIGRISGDSSNAGAWFEGYSTEEDSEKKILRNAFEPGDAWYRTGDLMRRDEQGYFYFIDRVGDTFRWKGENVATSEVSEAICGFPGIAHANVYGVRVPCAEGRAGMAAIVANREVDLAALRTHMVNRLPEYAQLLFLRVRDEMGTTDTLKMTKNTLVREGFDPDAIRDTVYFNSRESCKFVPLDKHLYERIQAGQVRL
jgi:fatty-acyl-CoA synthase